MKTKTMTCKELGGPCDAKMSAQTWGAMVASMNAHVKAQHPETAKEMEEMHKTDPNKWNDEMKQKWDATPLDEDVPL